ncbi:MAG: hypothetical protein HZA50_04670, partial [Planctomycetes bacterium]|nr:hypothetical protein [Planctomycetota bacterium]
MIRSIFAGICMAGTFVAVGCLETIETFTINPDGSGKVLFKRTVLDDVVTSEFEKRVRAEKNDPASKAEKTVDNIISGSKGVDAWVDLSYKKIEAGRISITGMAYFRDVNKLVLFGDKKSDIKWSKSDKGGMVLEYECTFLETPETQESTPKKLTDEEITAELKKERENFQQQKEMNHVLYGLLKTDIMFMLPGKIGEINGLTKTPNGGVRFLFEGKKYLDAVEKMLADDKLATEAIRKNNGQFVRDYIMQEVFGTKGPF